MLRDGDPCGEWDAKDPACHDNVCECQGPTPANAPFFPPGTPLAPNPDWWTALLFKRLIGRGVLAMTVTVKSVAAFGFCSRQHPCGVVVVWTNSNDSPCNVSLQFDGHSSSGAGTREEYHLTGQGTLTRCYAHIKRGRDRDTRNRRGWAGVVRGVPYRLRTTHLNRTLSTPG